MYSQCLEIYGLATHQMKLPKKAQDYYNQDSYIENAAACAERMHIDEVNIIKRYLDFNPGWKTLEIGCGKGILKDEFPNWTGLDVSKKALEQIPPKYPTILAPAEKIPIKDNVFDLVVMFDTIEHVQDPKKALQEAARVLKPGGYLIIRSPQLVWSKRQLETTRAPIILIKELTNRILDEFNLFIGNKIGFRFLENTPDYTKIGADWDATYLFSPHNVLLYLESNFNMQCLNKRNFPARLGINATKEKVMIFQKRD